MKRLAVALGLVFLLAAFAYPVFARGPGWGGYGRGGYGPGPGACWGDGAGYYGGGYGANLAPEQRQRLDQLRQDFYNQTADLRNEIWARNSELNALLNAPNPDPQKVQEVQKQVSDLKAKMAENRVNFELEAKKIAPEAGTFGVGPGYGRGGYGPRMGYGYGPRACWN